MDFTEYQRKFHENLVAAKTDTERAEMMSREHAALHAASHPKPPTPTHRRKRKQRPARGNDSLLVIEPFEYVERLCRTEVPSYGKIPCPLHDERTPSFKVYKDRGWYCFACARGGDIYSLAAALWNLDVQSDFVEIRQGLLDLFGYPSDVR